MDLLSNTITLVSTLAIMISLDWRLTILAVLVLPLFLVPARLLGNRVRTVVRDQLTLNSEMNALMNETLNVSGALLVKLFNRAPNETARFRDRAVHIVRESDGPGRPYLGDQPLYFLVSNPADLVGRPGVVLQKKDERYEPLKPEELMVPGEIPEFARREARLRWMDEDSEASDRLLRLSDTRRGPAELAA